MSNRLDDYVKPGDILDGKYRVERVLGSGGMGIVVQARHVTLGRPFAIKFMRAEALQDGENVARFQREAHAAASLLSEHTARVQDTGRLANGAPYMVMEFLVGKDLGQILEETGALASPLAIDLILQACEALAEAHARGIVHRDIKPRNLFLTHRVDGRALLKVLDFGLAKNVENNGDHALTRTSAVMGSPQYMSPEQMRASRDVDHHTDLWSLGVCLYELLTRAVPFDAPTVPMLCALVLKDAPRPPNELDPRIPPPLSAAIMRCLEKESAARFAHVGELASALEPFGSPAAQGSAARVHHVLATTRPPTSDGDGELLRFDTGAMSAPTIDDAALDATLAHSDTKTAAAFDSKPMSERPARAPFYRIAAILVGACVGSIALILFFLGRGRHPTLDHPSTMATTPPPAVDVPPPLPMAVSPLASPPRADDAGALAPGSIAPIATLAPPAMPSSRGAPPGKRITPALPPKTAAAPPPQPPPVAAPAPLPPPPPPTPPPPKKDFGANM